MAPTRKTRSIDCEKPTLNGYARRGSSLLMSEESLDTALSALASPLVSALMKVALTGLASTFGSRTAAWKSGVLAALMNAVLMLSPRVLNSSDRKTATPSVPPI